MESIEWRKNHEHWRNIYTEKHTYIHRFNATTMKCLIKISWPQRQQQQQWTITFTMWRNVFYGWCCGRKCVIVAFFNVLALQALTARYLCMSLYYCCEGLGGSINWFWNVIPLRGFSFLLLLESGDRFAGGFYRCFFCGGRRKFIIQNWGDTNADDASAGRQCVNLFEYSVAAMVLAQWMKLFQVETWALGMLWVWILRIRLKLEMIFEYFE